MEGAIRVIGIAGGTGSGKTTLARSLSAQFNAVSICVDDYYRPLDHLTKAERDKVNFDEPGAIDHELLIAHVHELRSGNGVLKPLYDFTRHTRHEHGEWLDPAETLIVEGIFALYWPALNDLYDHSVFVETEEVLRFERRLWRDIHERGRDEQEVRDRFMNHVAPMHNLHVQPTKNYAHCVISGATKFLQDSNLAEFVISPLRQPSLL